MLREPQGRAGSVRTPNGLNGAHSAHSQQLHPGSGDPGVGEDASCGPRPSCGRVVPAAQGPSSRSFHCTVKMWLFVILFLPQLLSFSGGNCTDSNFKTNETKTLEKSVCPDGSFLISRHSLHL